MTVDEEKLVSSPRNFAREGIETRGRGRKERRDPNGRPGLNRGFERPPK